MPSRSSSRAPATSRTPVVLAASHARTIPATELWSTTPNASIPYAAACANISSGWLAPRRKL